MAKLSAIAVDTQKVVGGVWVEHYLGYSFKIARMDNAEYIKYLKTLIEPHLKEMRAGSFDAEKRLDLTKQAAAKCILVGWKNVEDEAGKPIPYSPENALELFRKPELVDLYDFIINESTSAARYRQETKKESIKN